VISPFVLKRKSQGLRLRALLVGEGAERLVELVRAQRKQARKDTRYVWLTAWRRRVFVLVR
jgi:hypothetical protein